MPKLNLVGVIVASLVFYFIGILWYGLLFSDAWMTSHGLSEEGANNESPVWMVLGLVLTVMQVVGLAIILKWRGVAGPVAAATTAALLWLFFALPFNLYAFTYLTAHDATLFAIDASHMLIGWVVSAAILALFK
jgi:hypothetical protein